jgi:hypothetical protein
MQCAVCKKSIFGHVRRWNKRPMCRKCYGYFTGHVHVVRNRASSQKPRSWFNRLFGR